MLGFLKNSKIVLRMKQIQKVKELRKQPCPREPAVITVEMVAAHMAPYNKMPARHALEYAEKNFVYITRNL